MNKYDLEVTIKLKLTDEDVDDIMTTALEGGISYWCRKAEVVGEYLGEYASDQISRGGILKLYDAEDDEVYELTLEKFIKGFELWVAGGYNTYEAIEEGTVNCMHIDAIDADCIVQLSLFDEVLFA